MSWDHVTAIKSEGWALGNMNSSCIILGMGLLPYLNKNSNFSRGTIRIVEIDSVVTNQQRLVSAYGFSSKWTKGVFTYKISYRYELYWYEIFHRYHVNKYRAISKNWDELVPE